MRKLIFAGFIFVHFAAISFSQVLCVQCFDQDAPISPLASNLIRNGGFENGCMLNQFFAPASVFYNCNLTDWICFGGGISTYADMEASYVEGSFAAYFG